MSDVEVSTTGTLWQLLMATIVFLAVFILIIQVLPGEVYNPFRTYEQYYVSGDLKASNLQAWNRTDSFNITYLAFIDKTYAGADVKWGWNIFGLYPSHVDWRLPVFGTVLWSHRLNIIGEDPGSVGMGTLIHILKRYNNLTDTASLDYSCDHMTLHVAIRSNDPAKSLPKALLDKSELNIQVNYEIDMTKMGTNIWQILAQIFSFQVVKTGSLYIDLILNSLISVPTIVSTAYILYRLIAGLIPTLSGGGGQ